MFVHARRFVRSPMFLASLLFAGILTAVGAFGSIRIILPLRLLYWTLTSLSGAVSLVAVESLLARHVKRAALRNGLAVILAAIPTSLVPAAATTILLGSPASLRRTLAFFPLALMLNGLLLALWRIRSRREVIAEAAPIQVADDRVPPAIADKLPPRLSRSRLTLVEAQDHYLRVGTRDGEALVYMRFGDALAALAGSDGMRVHRSWWVARTSVGSMKFASGRGELTLLDGTVVPVSRKFAAAAKEMARRPGP